MNEPSDSSTLDSAEEGPESSGLAFGSCYKHRQQRTDDKDHRTDQAMSQNLITCCECGDLLRCLFILGIANANDIILDGHFRPELLSAPLPSRGGNNEPDELLPLY